ncbi:MAG: protease modulator HflK [Anaerohalosphaeraceae bacterium]
MSHSHDHHHHSGCGCKPQGSAFEPQDAAGKSLTSALKTSFAILKVIMIVLVVLFLASGIFKVREDEQALVLLFGKVQGLGDARVLKPGLHFTLPEPISEIIRIPVTKVQTLNVDSFWYFETAQEKLGQKNPFPPDFLDPVMDGYCLTRNDSILGLEGDDYNIVHSRWAITYLIDRPELFFENMYYRQPRPGEDFLDAASESINPMLESYASAAIVGTMIKYSIDDAVTSKRDISDSVRTVLQQKLDALSSGLKIKEVIAERIVWPRQVDDAFQASIQAGQQSKTAVTDAYAYKEKLLTDTAGPEAEVLLEKIKQPNLTQAQKEELVARMKGQVQGLISESRGYKTTTVAEARANAEYLQKLLPEYNKRPELVLQRLYQDAMEQIMAKADEKMLIQPGGEGAKELRIQINRDVKSKKKTEETNK